MVDIATANESTNTVGSGHWTLYLYFSSMAVDTAGSVVTLLLDFLARLQRLPLTLQTPRLRILPTDVLNQVTLNQDLSVSYRIECMCFKN